MNNKLVQLEVELAGEGVTLKYILGIRRNIEHDTIDRDRLEPAPVLLLVEKTLQIIVEPQHAGHMIVHRNLFAAIGVVIAFECIVGKDKVSQQLYQFGRVIGKTDIDHTEVLPVFDGSYSI